MIDEIRARWAHVNNAPWSAIAHAPSDISYLLSEVERLNDKCDALQCCANCKHHYVVINESKCFEGLPFDEWRFSKRAKPIDCDSKCDKWEECYGHVDEVPGLEVCHKWESKGTAGAELLAMVQRYEKALKEIAEIPFVLHQPPFYVKSEYFTCSTVGNPMQIAEDALK